MLIINELQSFCKLLATLLRHILHVFLAECVCFLTYLDEQASHLAIILFLSKEKQTNSGGVSLGLSLDFLIYIIR